MVCVKSLSCLNVIFSQWKNWFEACFSSFGIFILLVQWAVHSGGASKLLKRFGKSMCTGSIVNEHNHRHTAKLATTLWRYDLLLWLINYIFIHEYIFQFLLAFCSSYHRSKKNVTTLRVVLQIFWLKNGDSVFTKFGNFC